MNVIVGWIVGNTQSGPHSFRKKKPLGWQYSDGLVTESYHEAEVARLRAELQNAAKAALDAVALSCAKEREADALRVDAERYRWLRGRTSSDKTQICHYTNWSWNLVTGESADKTIDAAMGASA